MIFFREANEVDLPVLIKMLSDDQLGSKREEYSLPLHEAYTKAFQQIKDDPNNELMVIEKDGHVAGMLQLTFIPYLTYLGSWRCLIEGVRIHKDFRGQGLGTQFFKWAIDRAKYKNCFMVQLTSNKQRSEAIKFYTELGFEASHEGFKLQINKHKQ